MSIFLMAFILGVFLIYISICTYRFIRYRKTQLVILRFMASCMILFTFTTVYYNYIFIDENKANETYSELHSKDGSKSFQGSIAGADTIPMLPKDDTGFKKDDKTNVSNEQETEAKITAYFDNASPARGTTTNLIITGPPKGKVTAICQFKGHGTPYIMEIGANGLAVIPIKVENTAEPGLLVVVDISISYGDKQYKTNSVFTPQ